MKTNLAVAILAAGEGKRMKSALPKVLHPLLGEPQISYVIRSVFALQPRKLLVVLGKNSEKVKKVLPPEAIVVKQAKPLGTGDALRCCLSELESFKGEVLVVNGDTPLIKTDTLFSLVEAHRKEKNDATMLTSFPPDPSGYGRVVKKKGRVLKIVEEKDASSKEIKLREVNTGFYVFQKKTLFEYLGKLKNDNRAEEYYLTDVIGLLVADGFKVGTMTVSDWRETVNVNSRRDLVEAQKVLQERINSFWLEQGVTIVNPDLTFIGPMVKLARDVTILPLTFLKGRTEVGEGSVVGPSVELTNCYLGKRVNVCYTYAEETEIEEEAQVGPFARLREGTRIEKRARVGTFVEIKKSKIGKESKVPHLSYLGDAVVGKKVNIGAGTITCNYDGEKKHQTVIEDEAFVGSDTMLVAPIKVGRGAVTGAGSVLSHDVPPGSLAIERSEQKIIEGWLKKRKKNKPKKGED